ncbi:MAG: hypothetical protein Q7T04_06830 [Dehalococcoidia bacterium]|nr:hypothetical protein [Dehalococcoidia bacterium]
MSWLSKFTVTAAPTGTEIVLILNPMFRATRSMVTDLWPGAGVAGGGVTVGVGATGGVAVATPVGVGTGVATGVGVEGPGGVAVAAWVGLGLGTGVAVGEGVVGAGVHAASASSTTTVTTDSTRPFSHRKPFDIVVTPFADERPAFSRHLVYSMPHRQQAGLYVDAPNWGEGVT